VFDLWREPLPRDAAADARSAEDPGCLAAAQETARETVAEISSSGACRWTCRDGVEIVVTNGLAGGTSGVAVFATDEVEILAAAGVTWPTWRLVREIKRLTEARVVAASKGMAKEVTYGPWR